MPGHTPDPQTCAAQITKGKARFGVRAITGGGDRGLIKGQHIADLAPPGLPSMPAMTQPQIDTWLQQGTWHMDLCAQEVAAVRAAEGLRSERRRDPGRAQAVRDPRHATLAPLRAQVAKKPPYLTDPPRAKAQGAVHKLVASAKHLRSLPGSS